VAGDISKPAEHHRSLNQAIYEAERDARDKIAGTEKRTKQAIEEQESRLSQVQDQYIKQNDAERIRQEAALEGTKRKGYENLRATQRKFNQETMKSRREGEFELSKLQDETSKQLYLERTKGEASLNEQRQKFALMSDFERAQAQSQIEIQSTDHRSQKDSLLAQQQAESARIKADGEKRMENERTLTNQSVDKTKANLQARYDWVKKEHDTTLGALSDRSSFEIGKIVDQSARAIDAYAKQKNDPFYGQIRIGGEVEESDTHFTLKATIPKHEQQGVTVNVRGGNELVVSGTRKNLEKSSTPDGGTTSTSSFQTFTQSYPLAMQVEPRLLTREFVGDELTIRVPKKAGFEPIDPSKRKPASVERTRLEQPKFPDNIPIQPAAVATDMPKDERPPRRAGRPLGADSKI
jgi:hypothetical protein